MGIMRRTLYRPSTLEVGWNVPIRPLRIVVTSFAGVFLNRKRSLRVTKCLVRICGFAGTFESIMRQASDIWRNVSGRIIGIPETS